MTPEDTVWHVLCAIDESYNEYLRVTNQGDSNLSKAVFYRTMFDYMEEFDMEDQVAHAVILRSLIEKHTHFKDLVIKGILQTIK